MRRLVARTLIASTLIITAAAAWFIVYGGRYLQHDDPLIKADAVFVPAGMRAERLLEGYEVYRAGYAPVIVLCPGRPEPAERLLQERGVAFPPDVELQRDVLLQLRVPPSAVIAMRGYLDNTAAEAEWLRELARARGWRTVIVVTSKFHTRRSSFAFKRALEGTGVRIVMRSSRFDPADPARWWRTRADFRFVASEWQKLIAYRLGLGS